MEEGQPNVLGPIDIDDVDLHSTLLDAFPSFKDPAPEATPLPEAEKQLTSKICKEKRGMKRRRGHGRAASDPEALRRAASTLAAEFDLGSVTAPKPSAAANAGWGEMETFFGNDSPDFESFDLSSVSTADALDLFGAPQDLFAIPVKKKRRKSSSQPAKASAKKASVGDKKQGSQRGKYTCGRCGQPKEGHICPVAVARSVHVQVDLAITRSADYLALLNLGSSCRVLGVSKRSWGTPANGTNLGQAAISLPPANWQVPIIPMTMPAPLSAF